MRNNIEVRKNSNKIEKIGRMYYVSLKQKNGIFIKSRNGPWDYLFNARTDADRKKEINGKLII